MFDKLKDQAGDLAGNLAEKAGDLADKAGDLAGDLAEKAGDLAEAAGEKISDIVPDEIEDKVKDVAGKAMDGAKGAIGGIADKLDGK